MIAVLSSLYLMNKPFNPFAHLHSIASVEPSFIIYCTSNLDGTGDCSRVDNGQQIVCEIVPGSIINCTRSSALPVQCVMVSSVIASQAYFSCTPRREQGVNDQKINMERFLKPSTSIISPLISPDLPDPLTPFPDVFN